MMTRDRNRQVKQSISKKLVRYARHMAVMLVATALVSTSLLNRVQAAAGDFDPSFGNGGIVVTDFGFNTGPMAMAVQADGKIVAAGWSSIDYAEADFFVIRYNPNGSLDTTFGTGGQVTTDLGGSDSPLDIAIQADGRIVVVGIVEDASGRGIGLARYKVDGSLDTNFGTGGKVVNHLAPLFITQAIALQPDGKIVVAGFVQIQEFTVTSKWLVARYTATGSLDPTFNDGGMVTIDFLNHQQNVANDLAIQADGKIVVGGWTQGNSEPLFQASMARFNTNGTLDASFGTGGKVVGGLSLRTKGERIALQEDGKIILAGRLDDLVLDYSDIIVMRYNSNGSPDTSFGNGFGFVITDFPESHQPNLPDVLRGLALQADGKIIAAGSRNSSDSTLARYNSDGSLDSDFGLGGRVLFNISALFNLSGRYYPTAAAIYGGERILMAHQRNAGVPGDDERYFVVTRYEGDGAQTSADLSVQMSASAPTNTITYTITINNFGRNPSYYVTLKDTIPTNTTFVSFSAPPGWVVYSKPALGQSGTVSVSRAQLPASTFSPNSSATFTLVVRLSSAAAGTTISNRAYVSSSFTPDPFAANDRAIVYSSVP
jgi:uncharacterized delta-60 repeat protein/uncharacterized repeat protein (TIGR01451 family)